MKSKEESNNWKWFCVWVLGILLISVVFVVWGYLDWIPKKYYEPNFLPIMTMESITPHYPAALQNF